MKLADRKELHSNAYRARAGVIGILQSCICAYPVVQEETSSGHSDACPSHLIIAARQEREKEALAKARAFVGLFAGFDITDVAELSASEILVIGSLADAVDRRDVEDVDELMRCLPGCASCGAAIGAECLLLEKHGGAS